MMNPTETRSKTAKTALVTGASSGIGSEFARVLAEHGRNVVLVARRAERLEQRAANLTERYGVRAVAIPADLSQPNAAQRLYAELARREIQIDILINSAGFNVYGPFMQSDPEQEMHMLQVNLLAVVALTKLLARDMVARGWGRILNLGSTGSFAPAPLDSLYAASKAFILSFSEAIAEEFKGTGVSVTVLCPGPTSTEFAAAAGMSDTTIFSGRLMSAKEVVSIGYAALMRGQTTVITGLANKLQVWSMRFAPRAFVVRVAKGLMSRQTPSLRSDPHRV
jgi:short-subunit dehydrogenase